MFKKMNKEFEDFIKTFKPEFGNEKHIRALQAIERIRSKEKLVREKLQNAKAIEKKLKEIERDERNILFLLKQ